MNMAEKNWGEEIDAGEGFCAGVLVRIRLNIAPCQQCGRQEQGQKGAVCAQYMKNTVYEIGLFLK